MDGVQALSALSGTISGEDTLRGKLSGETGLNGNICVTKEYDAYTGEYDVTPRAFGPQILETANKVMKENVTIAEVPYWETSNESNGTTAYIAKEVEAYGD